MALRFAMLLLNLSCGSTMCLHLADVEKVLHILRCTPRTED